MSAYSARTFSKKDSALGQLAAKFNSPSGAKRTVKGHRVRGSFGESHEAATIFGRPSTCGAAATTHGPTKSRPLLEGVFKMPLPIQVDPKTEAAVNAVSEQLGALKSW